MLNITIIAAGREYQTAAVWAARTYVQRLSQPNSVSVLLSDQEQPLDIMKEHSKSSGFMISTFPFKFVKNVKHIMQLKCQALYYAVSRLKADELLFYADADTCCCRTLTLESQVKQEILSGKIGLVADLRDRHEDNSQAPWFLPCTERDTYVNAGVIVASSSALDMFKLFVDLSQRQEFSNPPYGDQTIINFVLGKYHRGRLLLLNRDYNEMNHDLPSATKLVMHFPGPKGPRHLSDKFARHRRFCMEALGELC